jgi:hypothetical protein
MRPGLPGRIFYRIPRLAARRFCSAVECGVIDTLLSYGADGMRLASSQGFMRHVLRHAFFFCRIGIVPVGFPKKVTVRKEYVTYITFFVPFEG